MDVSLIIQQCENLLHDLSLSYVKEWKDKNNSQAIGYMPVYIPRELVCAGGMLPVGIIGGGDEVEVIRGDAYFQSYICRIPRSTIELGLLGNLDCLDGFLFPAICDVIRNLSGMWKITFPQKYVKYIDFPQNFSNIGREYYKKELLLLKTDFENITHKKITSKDLSQAICLYNENIKWIQKLYDFRSEKPHLVLTYELYLLMRASLILDVREHTQLIKDYLHSVENEKRPLRDYVRVIVTGAFCEQPPLALIRALESSGCYIVDDDWVLGSKYYTQDIPLLSDPIDSLVSAYCDFAVSTASRFEESKNKGHYLMKQIKKYKAEGVIFAAPSFCDPALLERPMLQDILTKNKIPHTAFKYAENTGQIQVIKEETGTFADSIKLWGET
ncbi:MAG: benzoyl-CoA reductase subunit C [Deltaproteobacteria bacterium]|nr:benzoyl-CoA reductase subunit C [Deltaproteobacteria bacterium]